VADFVPANTQRFPLIALADSDGNLLANKHIFHHSTDAANLKLINVEKLFSLTDKTKPDTTQNKPPCEVHDVNDSYNQCSGKTEKSKMPSYSSFLDTEIGGIVYRVFFQPIPHAALNISNSKKELYVMGFVPKDSLQAKKLSVSPTAALWFVLILIILVALTPAIKVRFVSPKYAFSSADKSQIVIGLMVAVGVIGIGVADQLYYSFWLSEKHQQSHALHSVIQSDFVKEIDRLNKWRNESFISALEKSKAKKTNNGYLCRSNYFQRRNIPRVELLSCVNKEVLWVSGNNSNPNFEYLVEGGFKLNGQGRFDDSTISIWANPELYISRDVDLSYRDYFKQARDCHIWEGESQDLVCNSGFVFQRINNVRDGRKTTQFAFPDFDTPTSADKTVTTFNTRLRTFFHRVLPRNMGYMVIDDTGSVLFHSDDNRSLIENAFVETNNNERLKTLIESRSQHAVVSQFKTEYRGASHWFVGGRLLKEEKYSSAPLTLVVFYNESDSSLNNMLLVFLAIIIYLLMIITLFFVYRFSVSRKALAELLCFNSKNRQMYGRWTWLLAANVVFCIFSMGVVYDLMDRITLWLFCSLSLTLWFSNSINCKTQSRKSLLFPVAVLCSMALAFGLYRFGMSFSDNFAPGRLKGNYEISNWVFFVIGIISLFTAWHYNLSGTPKDKKTMNQTRYPAGYVGFLTALLFFVSLTPASLIINSTNSYLLQRKADQETDHLIQSNNAYTKHVNEYLNLLDLDVDKYRKQDWLSKNGTDETDYTPLKVLLNVFAGNESKENNEESKQTINWIRVKQDDVDEPLTDKILDTIIAGIPFADALTAKLSYIAETELNGSSENERKFRLRYLSDKYMLNASIQNLLLIIVLTLIQIAVLYKIVDYLVVRRLLGEHIVDGLFFSHTGKQESGTQGLVNRLGHLMSVNGFRIHLLQSHSSRAESALATLDLPIYEDGICSITELDLFHAGHLQKEVEHHPGLTLALCGFDEIAFKSSERQKGIEFIREVMQIDNLNILIISDAAPIFRLTKQHAYPFVADEDLSSASELITWSNFFAQFDKVYDWQSVKRHEQHDLADIHEIIDFEGTGWPELKAAKDEIMKLYYQETKNLRCDWLPAQVVNFFSARMGAFYRCKWEQCTRDERFMLYQMALGSSPNPANQDVIEHLLRRGYIYRNSGWHIINESFKRFVLSAEKEEDILNWTDEANSSVWTYLRIPVFTLLLVLLVVTVFSSGHALDSALGILTSVLGLVPLLLRNISLIRSGTGSFGE
jgi:hypothetical protein